MQQKTARHLAILISLLTMIGPFTIDTYLPAFESMERDFAIGRELMTKTLGYYIAAFGASTLIWGAIADGLGRKPVMLLSVGGYVLASFACALASSYEQFLLFRVLQGLAIGGALIAGRAMVRDIFETKEAQKVMAQAMMLFSAAPIIAPIFGGFLHDLFGWRSIFWFLLIYGSSVFLYVLLVARESLPRENRNSVRVIAVSKVYLRTLKHPHYLRLVAIFTATFMSFFVFIAGAPTVVFDILKLQATDFYVLFLPTVTGITLGAFASNRLLNRYSAEHILHVIITLMFAVALINLALNWVTTGGILRTVLPLVFSAFGLAVLMPIISVEILNCFPNNRGAATAMQSFIQMGFNGIVISLVVGALGAVLLNFSLAQTGLMAIAYGVWLIDRKRQKNTP